MKWQDVFEIQFKPVYFFSVEEDSKPYRLIDKRKGQFGFWPRYSTEAAAKRAASRMFNNEMKKAEEVLLEE